MVCRPHQYIVSGLAQGGIDYEAKGKTVDYSPSSYRSYSRDIYATKRDYAFEYKPVGINTLIYKRSADFEWKSQVYTPPSEIPITEPFRQPEFKTKYEPRFSSDNERVPQTHEPVEVEVIQMNDVKKTKQKLARLIMRELEEFGPREEHSHDHEHGPNTHVH